MSEQHCHNLAKETFTFTGMSPFSIIPACAIEQIKLPNYIFRITRRLIIQVQTIESEIYIGDKSSAKV
jgi:hypothetical protein